MIEEGNSYGPWVKAVGGESIIVNPNSNFTLNFFDTEGLPITNMTISSAAAMSAKMCGDIDDAVKAGLWRAMLTHYIHILYDQAYQEWSKNNLSLQKPIARRGIAVNKYWKKYLEDEDYLTAWAEFRDLLEANNHEVQEILKGVTEREITRYIQSNSKELRDISYAWFKAEDFPTLGQFVSVLKNNIDKRLHKEETVKEVATMLNQWTARKGDAGVLFDGYTTKKITGKIVHFELGKISKASEQLKSVVLFLISNTVRNHILTLPRSSKKQIVFEEMARMIGMKDKLGADLIAESYAQMRKFNCSVKSVVQQYGQFKRNPIREVVTGTSKQYYFLCQNDRKDLQDLARDVNIPERLQNVITQYPSPEHLEEGTRKIFKLYLLSGFQS